MVATLTNLPKQDLFSEVRGHRHVRGNVFTTSMDFIEADYVELCCSAYNQDCQHGTAFAELINAASQTRMQRQG